MAFITGPQVESILPMSGSDGISALVTIKVRFTQVMSPDTLTSDYIYLRPHGDTTQKIPCTTELEVGDNNTIVLNPGNPLSDNTEYDIIVVGQDVGQPIEDIMGNPLLTTYVSTFKTAEQDPVTPPVSNPDTEVPDTRPYVLSSYPRDMQYNISPLAIKVKIADPEDTIVTLPSVGIGETIGDFNLIEGEITYNDLEDIELLPIVYVEGTLEYENHILKFTPNEPLKVDTTYSIVITGQFQDSITKFHSLFEHFYGDVELIRNDLSRYIRVSDWLLARYISNVSEDAYAIVTATYGEDFDWTNRPYYIDEYVRFKTAYELVSIKYTELTATTSMKTLGDFIVENTVNATTLAAFMDALRKNMKKWEDALHGHFNRGYAKPVGTGRRESGDSGSGYPEYMDRRLKDLDGTKSD